MCFAEDYNSSLNALIDSSGNERHGYVTAGTITRDALPSYGANNAITYLQGTSATKIQFAVNSLPANFTIASITANNVNFAHAHLQGQAGVAFYNFYTTNVSGNVPPETNWCLAIGKTEVRATNYGRNFRSNGQDRATIDGGWNGGGRLTINDALNPAAIPPSDFAISCIIVWDKHISDTDILHIETAFNNYLNSGL